MRATLFCVIALAQGWKMPVKSSLIQPQGKKCEVPTNFERKPTLDKDTKWKGSQRQPTKVELMDKNYLADPYLHTIYYINMEKSTDRKQFMDKQLNRTVGGKVKIARFAAKLKTDALKMNKTDYTVNNAKTLNTPGAGTVATYMSHYHLLEKIAKVNDSRAVFVILEDDGILKEGWDNEVMCQIKLLPADWDVFKFGFWPMPESKYAYDVFCTSNKRQAVYNQFTCNQRTYANQLMGNLGYAVRPNGARQVLEHLRQVPLMDVDGAMMPGCCISGSTTKAQNFYVSRWPLIRHGKFNSVRLMDKHTAATTPDLSQFSSGDDERETSYQARVRLQEAAKRGQLPSYEPKDDEPVEHKEDKAPEKKA